MHILNKKAYFEYEIVSVFEFGIVLLSSEIKAIREGKVNIQSAYLNYKTPHLYVYNMFISRYKNLEHKETRDRVVLLHAQERNKILSKIKLKGFSLVPLELFFNKKGFVKLKCGLGLGKKLHDKRRSIKEKEHQKEAKKLFDEIIKPC